MALINWSADLSMDYPEMDVQHQHLIALVNTLYDRFEKGQHGRALLPMFAELVEAASAHFEYEEEMLEKRGYPRLADHRDEHRLLLDQLAGLAGELHNGNKSISAETFEFLCDWLVDHIVGADKDSAAHIRASAPLQPAR